MQVDIHCNVDDEMMLSNSGSLGENVVMLVGQHWLMVTWTWHSTWNHEFSSMMIYN
jgi:hypothetical protein